MKRDIELVRQILLRLESSESDQLPLDLEIEGYTSKEINFHVRIMWEAGLINIFGDKPSQKRGSIKKYFPVNLTWEGHEFLEASKDEEGWNTVLTKIKKAGKTLTFELIKAMLIQYTKNELGM